MSTQSHECKKDGCYYCYEINRINQPPILTAQTISEMIAAALLQYYMVSQAETVGVAYSEETDRYIKENITLPSNVLAKNIGRTAGAVNMRKVYLRRQG